MSRKVLILDTSVLCCLLGVAGKETAGPSDDRWTRQRVEDVIEREQAQSTFVLPIATLIETGNHISQAPRLRYECAVELAKLLAAAAKAQSPWASFTEQSDLWQRERLLTLGKLWPDLAKAGTSIGDATIKDVAEYYARAGFRVEILTGDAGLKAYEPQQAPLRPRRRSRNR